MPGLSRVLPFRTAVSTSVGLASAAINFLACVEIASLMGGPSGWIAILVAGVLILLSAGNFSELTAMYPSAAALRVWLRRGLSDRLSMVGALVYMMTVLFVIAADAFVLAHAFKAAVPAVPGLVWILVLLVMITWSNSRGIKISGAVQDANALLLLGTLGIFSIVVILGHVSRIHLTRLFSMGPHWMEAVALGVFIYVGFEWVTPLAEEFQDVRAIPRGMYSALGLIAVAFGLFSLALSMAEPNAQVLSHSVIPQLTLGTQALGSVGFWWMTVITLTTAMTTFNGGLATASRFVYALARERVLPAWFSRLNARLVPMNALMTLSFMALILSLLVYWSGQYVLLINAGAGVESLMYMLVALVVIRLRIKEPNTPRPFRVSGYPVLPAIAALAFLVLGAGALMTPSVPHGVPWALVFVSICVLASWWYVVFVVPQLKAKIRTRVRRPSEARPK